MFVVPAVVHHLTRRPRMVFVRVPVMDALVPVDVSFHVAGLLLMVFHRYRSFFVSLCGLKNPLSCPGPVCYKLHDLVGVVAKVDIYTLHADDPVGVDDHKTHQPTHWPPVTRQVELFCYREGWIQEQR